MAYQAARAGLPGDATAVNSAAQVNQFLVSHGVTPVYEGVQAWTVATGTDGTESYFSWLDGTAASGHGQLSAHDVDQPFTLPSGVTSVGRVTVAVKATGSGAGLQATLYPDNGSGDPDTASPLATAYVPASCLTATAAPSGLPAGPLATARFNTYVTGAAGQYDWAQPAVTSGGAGNYAAPVTAGNYTLFVGGQDSSASAIADVTAVAYLGSGQVSGAAPCPPLPQAATQMSACYCGGTVLAAGGFSGSTAYANVWAAPFAPGTGVLGSWTAQQALPAPVITAGMTSWGGTTVYSVGGFTSVTSGACTASVWQAQVSGGQLTSWTAAPPLPAARSRMFAAVIGDWLIVAGGQDTNGTVQPETWYSAINPDGTLAGWQAGPDLQPGVVALIPGWNQAVTGSALIVVSGETDTYPAADSTLTQVLTVTSDGPAPEWQVQAYPSVPGAYQCGTYQSGLAGEYEFVGYHLAEFESGPLLPAPLADIPLPASGLTAGSTYHVVFHQDGGDDADYLELGEVNAASSLHWLYAAAGSNGPWTAVTGNVIAMTVYDGTPGGPPWHLVADSGAQVTTLIYEGGWPGRLIGVMESTLFPAGSPETALSSVTQVTWADGMPTGTVTLA